jgi:hypothetical protein
MVNSISKFLQINWNNYQVQSQTNVTILEHRGKLKHRVAICFTPLIQEFITVDLRE